MLKTLARRIAGLACVAGLTLAAADAAAQPPGFNAPIRIQPVKPGFYLVIGMGGNVSVREGTDGLIVVDTKLPSQKNYDDLIAQIRTVTQKPVRYVIDTHFHGDHAGNNDRFIAAGATVIAQDAVPALIDAMPAGSPKPAKPTQTYKSRMDIAAPGAKAVLYHFAPAHTGGDTIVYFPDLKIVAMGDVLTPSPNFDFANGGSLAGYIKSYDAVLKLDFDTAIPGHSLGPYSRAQVAAQRKRLGTFFNRAKASVKAGVARDQFIRSIKVDDLGPDWTMTQYSDGARVDSLWKEAGGT